MKTMKHFKETAENEFDDNFVFLLKASNIFAQMSYDIVEEIKTMIKEYNSTGNKHDVILSGKFKRSVKKMNEHRDLMGHYALQATDELSKIFEEIEDKDETQIKPLSLFQCVCDCYDCFVELLGAILLEINENPARMREFWNLLKAYLKTQTVDVNEPDWDKLEELSLTRKIFNK